jgi:hypothetical protein
MPFFKAAEFKQHYNKKTPSLASVADFVFSVDDDDDVISGGGDEPEVRRDLDEDEVGRLELQTWSQS